jgi:NitT/TauT family transport system substrate-binding protein
MTHTRRRSGFFALALALAAGTLVACGGDDNSSSEPATTAAGGSAAATAPAETTKVKLTLQWVTQAQFAGYYAALDKGYYKEEGIDLTIQPGGPDVNPI